MNHVLTYPYICNFYHLIRAENKIVLKSLDFKFYTEFVPLGFWTSNFMSSIWTQPTRFLCQVYINHSYFSELCLQQASGQNTTKSKPENV